MKEYNVGITETSYGSIQVRAKSEEEALAKARQKMELGDFEVNESDCQFYIQ